VSLAFLLAALCSVSAQAAIPSPQPSPQSSLTNPDGTLNWQSLDQALQQASQTANDSATSASELLDNYKLLQTQYTNTLQLIKQVDQDNRKVVQALQLRSDLWLDATLVTSGTAVGAIAAGPRGALYGAGAGLASAGFHWFGKVFHLWR
jgi:hypothetical protein